MRVTTDGPSRSLARTLRALRKKRWSGHRISRAQLAAALDTREPVDAALVAEWESDSGSAVPSQPVLAAYATFFATERSVARTPFRVIGRGRLTAEERAVRDDLLVELTELWREASGEGSATNRPGFLRFADGGRVTIVCPRLPQNLLTATPMVDPESPDYEELSTYADPDALFEVHGHIRAVNPDSQVDLRVSTRLVPDDYVNHLVLLGGVDWNVVTRDLLSRVDMPVLQSTRFTDDEIVGFEAEVDDEPKQFAPVLRTTGGQRTLIEDVAHVYRGPNPYNPRRTVTTFNGMFARGTLGAVRALTDAEFRDRNEAYLRERFAGAEAISIITKVVVANGRVVTPDWTVAANRLHEWPALAS